MQSKEGKWTGATTHNYYALGGGELSSSDVRGGPGAAYLNRGEHCLLVRRPLLHHVCRDSSMAYERGELQSAKNGLKTNHTSQSLE